MFQPLIIQKEKGILGIIKQKFGKEYQYLLQVKVEPGNINDCMIVGIDENVKKGDVIAENKGLFGLFKTSLKSPIDGSGGGNKKGGK